METVPLSIPLPFTKNERITEENILYSHLQTKKSSLNDVAH